MNKVICSTSINPPTQAIEMFDAMSDWTLVVAGDKKTPENYSLKRGFYLNPEKQEWMDPELSEAIGWNCIQRRNMAFLWAIEELGANIVATVDDDNAPMPHWGRDLLLGRETVVHYHDTEQPAFDPVWAAGAPNLWHRGFPLQLLSKRSSFSRLVPITAHIQADFWNGDPDIDAICRMEHAPTSYFHPKFFPMASNKPSPFNSQNTFLVAKVMPHYFMFPGIGRMDDIWASFHSQAQGFNVVYGQASVNQQRNPHILTDDMRAEYIGYENNLDIVERIPTDKDVVLKLLPDQAKRAFDLYRKHF